MAWLTVSISDPAAPVAVETARLGPPRAGVAMVSPTVSPAAPFTHSFRRISGAEVRALMIVQMTATGVVGTRREPPRPSGSGVRPGLSQVICEV